MPYIICIGELDDLTTIGPYPTKESAEAAMVEMVEAAHRAAKATGVKAESFQDYLEENALEPILRECVAPVDNLQHYIEFTVESYHHAHQDVGEIGGIRV